MAYMRGRWRGEREVRGGEKQGRGGPKQRDDEREKERRWV
jgi:hypothetical protein